MYTCTHCQKIRCVIKHLYEYEVENTHAQEQRLARVQINEQLSELIGEVREEKWALATEQESFEAEIWELQKQLFNSMHVT